MASYVRSAENGERDSDLDDPVLRSLLDVARHDAETLGVLLHGSRGAGMADDRSDYDLLWVLTEAGYRRRDAIGRCEPQVTMREGHKHIEVAYSSPERLQGAGTPEWYVRGLATARILVDKDGSMERLLDALLTVPEERVRTDVPLLFDGYLNCFYRSMKASERGNELGARLQAAESLIYLVRTLFLLERRPVPFHDRLIVSLRLLKNGGWREKELEEFFLGILRDPDPRLQIRLQDRVERLMRERGYGDVVDTWEGEIERVKAAYLP